MTDFNKYPHVFSPIKVGTMTLKNRIVFAPMICCLETPSGEVTSEYIEWIAQQARTGASLITIGGTSIDHETGDDFEGEIDVTTDKNLIGLKRMRRIIVEQSFRLNWCMPDVELCRNC